MIYNLKLSSSNPILGISLLKKITPRDLESILAAVLRNRAKIKTRGVRGLAVLKRQVRRRVGGEMKRVVFGIAFKGRKYVLYVRVYEHLYGTRREIEFELRPAGGEA